MKTQLAIVFVSVLTISTSWAQSTPGLPDKPNRTTSDLLNLSGTQLVQLDQLYDYLHGNRSAEETKFAKKKSATDKDRENSQSAIRKAFDTAQREAKKLLDPGQVYLLEQRHEEVRRAPDVRYSHLYIGKVEDFLGSPLDQDAAKRWREAKDSFNRGSANSPYASNRFWNSGLGFGFGFGHHHHWHNGHIHHHFGFGHHHHRGRR